MPDSGNRWTLATLTVLGCMQLTALIFALLPLVPFGLFGNNNYRLNHDYSTKTMHVHKLNHLTPWTNTQLNVDHDPMHWDALGLIIPETDEKGEIIHYKIGLELVGAPRKDVNVTCFDQGLECVLRNNAGSYLLLNGESLSAISEISPSVYLTTLILIYTLSSVPLTLKFLKQDSMSLNVAASDRERYWKIYGRIVISGVLIFLYVISLFLAYSKSQKQTEGNIFYNISSHLASIMVCFVTLIVYLLHLSSSSSTWEIPEQSTVKKQPPSESYEDGGVARTLQDVPKPKGTEASNGSVEVREISLIIAVTVFLGGMGNVALTSGVVLEVEAQFILACSLGFAVLEIASDCLERYRVLLTSQYENAKQGGARGNEKHLAPEDNIQSIRNSVFVIRSVILILQGWILYMVISCMATLQLQDIQAPIYTMPYTFLLYGVLGVCILFHTALLWHEYFEGVYNVTNCTSVLSFLPHKKTIEIWLVMLAFLTIFVVLMVHVVVMRDDNDENLLLESVRQPYKLIQSGIQSAIQPEGMTDNPTCKPPDLAAETYKDLQVYLKTKVYFWTRYWKMEKNDISTKTEYCQKGFEYHWMGCQNTAK